MLKELHNVPFLSRLDLGSVNEFRSVFYFADSWAISEFDAFWNIYFNTLIWIKRKIIKMCTSLWFSLVRPQDLPMGSFLSVCPSVCKSVCNVFLSGVARYFFPSFYWKVRLNKWRQGLFSDFFKSSYYSQNRANETFLSPKSTRLNFFLNLFLRFFRD